MKLLLTAAATAALALSIHFTAPTPAYAQSCQEKCGTVCRGQNLTGSGCRSAKDVCRQQCRASKKGGMGGGMGQKKR